MHRYSPHTCFFCLQWCIIVILIRSPPQILQSYNESDVRLTKFLQKIDLYVTPVLNVDGYMFSWTNQSVSFTMRHK